MKFKLNVKIGNSVIELSDEAKNTLELFKQVSFFTQLPTKCGNCNSEDLIISYRNPQGYDYYDIRCKECSHEFKFGISKERPGELFPKGWEPPYEGNDASETQVERKAPPKVIKKAASTAKESEIEEVEVEEETEVETTPEVSAKSSYQDVLARVRANKAKTLNART